MIEALLAVVVIGVMAGATVPIMTRLSDAMAIAKKNQYDSERVAFAMERTQRFLRDLSADATTGNLLGTISQEQIVNAAGGSLYSLDTDKIKFDLQNGISGAFFYPEDGETTTVKVTPLRADGTDATTMAETHYFAIELTLNDFKLTSMAFPRSKLLGR
jgi:type II secretory pathway pseudopilin PulG